MLKTIDLLMSLVRQALLEKINMKQVFRYGLAGALNGLIYLLGLIVAVEFVRLKPVGDAVIAYLSPFLLHYTALRY